MRLIDADALAEKKFQERECNGLGEGPAYRQGWNDAIDAVMDNEPSAQPETNCSEIPNNSDTISRQAAIDALYDWSEHSMTDAEAWHIRQVIGDIKSMPSSQPEPLTDKEQRIFLAAMGREEKVCKQVDEECCREPYEDSLVRVCHEIIRKVKATLWET